MDLKKVVLIVGVIAGGLSLVNHFVGGLRFSGFRHTKMMKNGLDKDMKIAGGDWHMERTDRTGIEVPAEEPVQVVVKAEPFVPVEPEPEQKKPGYNFQTNVKAMAMPKGKVEVKNGKDKKKKKKKKKTAVARKSVEIPAPQVEESKTENTARTTQPTNLNPVAARQLSEFLQGQAGGGVSNADQVFSQLFQFGGNLQSIARLFELYNTKQIDPGVFFTVLERVMMSPNVQFRLFAVEGLKGIVRSESYERMAALLGIETDARVIAALGASLGVYASPQNIQFVEPALKSVNPSARYQALTTIKAAMQATGSQVSANGNGSPRESRGAPSTSSPTAGLTLVQKFQALAQSVRELQAQESEKRIAALANEVYYSILQFVEARRVAGTN